MPIIFVSLNENFIELAKQHRYEAHCMKIEEYVPKRKTYYVSPANSLGFMDGGIDLALSRNVFPNIEKDVKARIRQIGKQNLLGRYYLPIGSSTILSSVAHDKYLVVAPTMLLPQDVSTTLNAYYATMAVLYNVLENKKEDINNVDIILTSMCCGYGKLSEEKSLEQILKALADYRAYKPQATTSDSVLAEPNLFEQPRLYQNTEWFTIDPRDLNRR